MPALRPASSSTATPVSAEPVCSRRRRPPTWPVRRAAAGLRFAGLITHPAPRDGICCRGSGEVVRRGLEVGASAAAGRACVPGARASAGDRAPRRHVRLRRPAVPRRRRHAVRTARFASSRPSSAGRRRTARSWTPARRRSRWTPAGDRRRHDWPRRRVPGGALRALSEEHGQVDFSACDAKPEIGEVVTIIPNHACGTVNMHDQMAVHRGGGEIEIVAVAGRGLVR